MLNKKKIFLNLTIYGIKQQLFFFLFFLVISLSAQIDIKNELQNIKEISKDNLGLAIKYTDSILSYDFKNKDTIILEYAKLLFKSHNYKKAMALFETIEKNAKKNNLNNYLLASYLGIAQSNSFLQNQDNAIKYANKALKLAVEQEDLNNQYEALNIFAYVYFTVKNYKKAIIYLKKYARIQKKKKILASIYNNLSECHIKLDEMDSAKYYLSKSLPIFKALNDKVRIAMTYNNIGDVEHRLNNISKSIFYYKNAIDINEKIGANNMVAYSNLAEIYLELSELKEASLFYEKSLKIAINTSNTAKQEFLYNKLLKLALEQNKTKKAKKYLKKRDSVNNINLDIILKDKAKLIETQFKQQIEQNNLKQKIEISKKNTIITSTLIFILLFFIAFLFQINKNTQYKIKNDNLLLKQKVLRAQMNPHFIFNALTSIQRNLLDEDILNSSKALARFAKLIRKNFEFIDKTHISLEEELDVLKNYIETQKIRFKRKFDYQIEIANNLDSLVITIPPLLLQPFVENAIEHGLKEKKEKGLLKISIQKENDLISFIITDDGVGFKKIKAAKNREHAIAIFIKRLKLRGFGEEKTFSIRPLEDSFGTKVKFSLKV